MVPVQRWLGMRQEATNPALLASSLHLAVLIITLETLLPSFTSPIGK